MNRHITLATDKQWRVDLSSSAGWLLARWQQWPRADASQTQLQKRLIYQIIVYMHHAGDAEYAFGQPILRLT